MQHKVYTLLFLILIYNKTLCNKIEIKGSVKKWVTNGSGEISICGDVSGDVSNEAGNIQCGNVSGNIKNEAGNIKCGDVTGSVSTMTGNIKRK